MAWRITANYRELCAICARVLHAARACGATDRAERYIVVVHRELTAECKRASKLVEAELTKPRSTTWQVMLE